MDYDEIKKQKKLKKQQEIKKKQQEGQKKKIEQQKQAILRQILTQDARSRLKNIELANEEMANKIKSTLIQIAQSGSIQGKIDDERLKQLLKKIKNQKKDISIKRR